jgi:hypothetical protein
MLKAVNRATGQVGKLIYDLPGQAWYADTLPAQDREQVSISLYSLDDRGGYWELAIRSYTTQAVAGDWTRIELSSDSYQAFTDLPELFAALAEHEPATLDAVVELLRELGAEDTTQRVKPAWMAAYRDAQMHVLSHEVRGQLRRRRSK